MTRITPRTCLWPLTGSLLLTFCLSIALTFRSDHHCYAGTCGEWLFPLQARLHVVVWYCWVSISVAFLSVRAFHPQMRKVLRYPLIASKLPVVGKRLTLSGLLVAIWIIVLYGTIVGIWWRELSAYFVGRGFSGGVYRGNNRLAAIALTGHVCDVTMGMALIPISRHSALASFFKLSVSTTLAFHMLTAYTLFTLVVLHGSLYVSWVPVFESLSDSLRMVFPVLNPTYLYNETWPGNTSSLGVWRASLIFTGSLTTLIFALIFITTLPVIRLKHFNVFYFTHLLAIVAVVIICLHASTMFYCLSPGLLMWVLDWGMRLYELRKKLHGQVESLGKGWYSLTAPLPRHRLDGCACKSPLAHFFIHHTESSVRELHPFTTITHLASQDAVTPLSVDDLSIQFLFRKTGKSNPSPVTTTPREQGWKTAFGLLTHSTRSTFQWTNKLASLADQPRWESQDGENTSSVRSSTPQILSDGSSPRTSLTPGLRSSQAVDVGLRLEGPYFTAADPSRFRTVVCFVAGTGVSGAIAIASAFRELKRQQAEAKEVSSCSDGGCDGGLTRAAGGACASSAQASGGVWKRCIIVWSVRADDYVELPWLQECSSSRDGSLEVRICLTGGGRPRLDFDESLADICGADGCGSGGAGSIDDGDADEGVEKGKGRQKGSIWVYLSGPNAFIEKGEQACKRKVSQGVEWYGARWDI